MRLHPLQKRTNEQINNVIQAECSRSPKSLSLRYMQSETFPHHTPPHYKLPSLTGMKERGFSLPRMMDGSRGEYEVRCEMLRAHFPFFVYSEAK